LYKNILKKKGDNLLTFKVIWREIFQAENIMKNHQYTNQLLPKEKEFLSQLDLLVSDSQELQNLTSLTSKKLYELEELEKTGCNDLLLYPDDKFLNDWLLISFIVHLQYFLINFVSLFTFDLQFKEYFP